MPTHDPWDHNPDGYKPEGYYPKDSGTKPASLPRDHSPEPGPVPSKAEVPSPKVTDPEATLTNIPGMDSGGRDADTHAPAGGGDADTHPGAGGTHAGPTPETHSPETQVSSEGDFLPRHADTHPPAGGGDADTHSGAGGTHADPTPEAHKLEAPFLPHDHDHGHCISGALLKAEEICAERGARLTRIRRSVLEFVWESHSPVGAYDILERMNAPGPLPGGGPRSAPITVYRALEFLMAQGLVHRLASLNAYTGCGIPGTPHGAHFLICEDCGAAAELHDPDIDRAITQGAARAGFAVKAPVVEVQGRCPACTGKEGD